MRAAKRVTSETVRPTKADLLKAIHNTVPDVIAPDLHILFCGINPGLYSAWSRHHFAKPGNRFWPALFAAGFTPSLLHPAQEHELLPLGYGITNLVDRATVGSGELSPEELVAGGKKFCSKVEKYKPRVVAILGVSAFRLAFGCPEAKIGHHPAKIADAVAWVLPNPSGLNAHFTPKTLAELFRDFRLAVEQV